MPKNKKLQKQIEKKLDQLTELLDQIDEARIINSDDSETWDSDTLHNLVANLKETLELLQDKLDEKKMTDWGEPLVLEVGLCSLVDEFQEEEDLEEF